MNETDHHFRSLPVFRELFLQWRAARASAEPRARPFSRDWETLLQDARLTSADLRREADRDARALAQAGLVQLKTVRLRPYQIDRVAIPLAAEPRLREIFAEELPEPSEPRADLAAYPWAPPLHFLRDSRTGVPFADLQALNEYLLRHTPGESVPIKERSLAIFGDEKRLDALLLTSLFRPDRLTPQLLHFHLVPEPLAWKRGRLPEGPVIILENAATWDSFCRWDAATPRYSAIVYGCGNRFRDGVSYLQEIFRELGGERPIHYFGDLDLPGARIPIQAQLVTAFSIQPELWCYAQLLNKRNPQPCEAPDDLLPGELDWFGPLAPQVEALLLRGQRLAQEFIGWDFLRASSPPDNPNANADSPRYDW